MIATYITIPTDGFYFRDAGGPGIYKVRLKDSAGNVKAVTGPQTLTKDEYRNIDFRVNPADPLVEGFVVDDEGNAMGSVTIELYHAKSGRLVASKETGAGGHYAFRFSAPGQYRVAVVAPEGYAADQPSVDLKLKQFDEVQVNFTLRQQ